MKLCEQINKKLNEGIFDEKVANVYFSKDKEDADFIYNEIKTHPKLRYEKLKVEKAKGWKGFVVKVLWHSLADRITFSEEGYIAYDGPSDYRRDIEKDVLNQWKDKNYK